MKDGIDSSVDTRARPLSPGVLPRVWPASFDRAQLSQRLRLSLTSHCNLACFFCHNEGQGPLKAQRSSSLSIEQWTTVAQGALQSGVREIKLTGGEPLLYSDGKRNVIDLIAELRNLDSHGNAHGLSLTTNGLLLNNRESDLAESGLDRITYSLHSVKSENYRKITQRQNLKTGSARVLDSIERSVAADLGPVKVNTVLFGQRDGSQYNIDEISEIVAQVRSRGVSHVRFYTLLKHQEFAEHASVYRYWSDGLLNELAISLKLNETAREDFVRLGHQLIRASRADIYPKRELNTEIDGITVTIEFLESGRFGDKSLPDEGPYALRVAADGKLTGLMGSTKLSIDLAPLVDGSHAVSEIAQAFSFARNMHMPAEAVD
jgi:molybdenum cofactor biosynthesis enzyme MoaA